MNKIEKRSFNFSYCEIVKEKVENAMTIELTPGEVKSI